MEQPAFNTAQIRPHTVPTFVFGPHLKRALLNERVEPADFDGLKHQLLDPKHNPSPPAPAPSAPVPALEPQRPPRATRNARSHRHRAKGRVESIEARGHQHDPSLLSKHVASAVPIQTPVNAVSFPKSVGAYSSTPSKPKAAGKIHEIAKLQADGFTLVDWDASYPRPIADKGGRIIALLASTPKDPAYTQACEAFYALMMQEGAKATFSKDDKVHKRGRFPAVNIGITHGQGGDSPVNLQSPHNPMLERILSNPLVQRVATYPSSALSLWAPKLHQHYVDRLFPLWEKFPHLRRILSRGIFPTAAFNFGPQVCTFQHRDHLNVPYGWCAVQALGRFDPNEGGHLVLWEPKLIIPFPANSLIFLPSAAITHSNLPVQPGDTRLSFTQYCPGALLRFVDNDMNTDAALAAKDPERYAKRMSEREDRWSACIDLLPTLSDLSL